MIRTAGFYRRWQFAVSRCIRLCGALTLIGVMPAASRWRRICRPSHRRAVVGLAAQGPGISFMAPTVPVAPRLVVGYGAAPCPSDACYTQFCDSTLAVEMAEQSRCTKLNAQAEKRQGSEDPGYPGVADAEKGEARSWTAITASPVT